MLVYNYVTVETEDRTYENVVAVQNGDVVGIVPDPATIEREYGRGGPQPEQLFKAHARYVVPVHRVVEIDRGAGDPTSAGGPDPDTGSGSKGAGDPAETGGVDDETDDPDDVFDGI